MRHSIHSRIQFKTKLIYILSSAGNFSPVSFAIPFFSLTNFVGLFSFQLLTFVCRTPSIDSILSNLCVPPFAVFHFVQTQPKKKTTDFLREEAGGFLNFPSVVWNSVSEDFVVTYAVLVYPATIA